jgi:hypothetical protein
LGFSRADGKGLFVWSARIESTDEDTNWWPMSESLHGRPHLTTRFVGYRYLELLLVLMVLILATPFLRDGAADRAAIAILLSILLFATVVASSKARHLRWIAAGLSIGCGAIIFTGLALEHRLIYLPVLGLLTIYLVYTVAVMLRRMVVSPKIDADILCGAAAIYFMIGVTWAMTYWIMYEVDHKAFAAISALRVPPFNFHHFLYFSLSTLTSLGLGDITPVDQFAQIWTTLEAATANLYIALLVARLVSVYRY